MPEGISFVCPRCDRECTRTEQACPDHPGAVLEPRYDVETLRERFDPGTSRRDLWRYEPLLPVTGERPVTLAEGWTDLVDARETGESLGVDLALKLEGSNPTGSAKDRGSAVVATYAREQGYGEVVCASTGNAAASIAAYAARGGLDCSLFVPDRIPEAKAVQPRVYGASLVTVDGGYGAACTRCREYATGGDAIDRTAGANPYTPAGARTLGFELAEQTDRADWVAVPMGNGGTIADLWRGFELFVEMGLAADPPRLLGVQAAGAAAIHESDQSSSPDQPGEVADQREGTCADSVDVDRPHRADDARQALEESGGRSIAVSDEGIKRALRLLGRNEGVFVEPASAAALAGVEAAVARGIIDASERVVAVMTGNGLKDTRTALEATAEGE